MSNSEARGKVLGLRDQPLEGALKVNRLKHMFCACHQNACLVVSCSLRQLEDGLRWPIDDEKEV